MKGSELYEKIKAKEGSKNWLVLRILSRFEKALKDKDVVSSNLLERLDAHRKIKPVKCWGFYDEDATKINNLATCNDCDRKSSCFVTRWLEEFDRLMEELKK